MEPNDSLAMALLVKMGFSFPYELPAVIDHDYRSGSGVRDSHIPNFLYRWNGHEVFKTAVSITTYRSASFPCAHILIGISALLKRIWT